MALNDVLARLSVELGLDTAAFSTGARKARADTKDIGDRAEAMGRRVGAAGKAVAIAGAAVAGAFVLGKLKQLALEGLEYASSLGETAQQLGVSTRALQEYRYAASQVGVSTDEMDAALSKLTRSIGEADAGSKTQSEAFAKLGISVRDAGGQIKDAGDLLPEIAEKLKGLESPAERAALLVDLFGKSGQKLAPLLADGAAGVNGLRDAAQKLGIVLSDEQIQKADETADKLSALNQVLSAKISGAVADNTGSILELVNALIKLVEYAGKAVRALRIADAAFFGRKSPLQAAVDDLGPGVQATFSQEEYRARIGGGAAPLRSNGAFLRTAPKKTGTFTGGLGPLKSQFASGGADQFDAGRGIANLAALAGPAATAVGRLVPVLKQLDTATSSTRESFEKLSPAVQTLFEQLFPREAAEREYEAAVKALRGELDKGVISLERFEEAKRRLSAASVGLDATDEIGVSAYEDLPQLEANLDAVESGLYRFNKSLATNADHAEVANVRIVRSFEDMARDTLSSLSQLSGAIKGGGFLNILSAVVGLGLQLGGAGAFGKSIQTNINKPRVPGFASGTMSAPRGLALVGERGPELVRFAGGERVFPNGTGPASGGSARIQVIPSPYFNVVVDQRIGGAAPAIMDGSARVAAQRGARAQARRLA